MVSICKRKERYKTIRFQENANRKIRDYKINEFLKFLKLLHKDSVSHDIKDLLVMAIRRKCLLDPQAGPEDRSFTVDPRERKIPELRTAVTSNLSGSYLHDSRD